MPENNITDTTAVETPVKTPKQQKLDTIALIKSQIKEIAERANNPIARTHFSCALEIIETAENGKPFTDHARFNVRLQ